MQYKVLNNFIDKHTRELFEQGSLYSCEDEGRVNELATKGFIEKVAQVKKPTRKTKKVSEE